MKKVIVLNASPRRDWNTAKLLHEAERGAQQAGARTEYHDLYAMDFTGCRSCMACKRVDARRCHCFWKDDLSPVIDAIYAADALIVGSPIYFSRLTSRFMALSERLCFVALSYDDYSRPYFDGSVNLGGIFTMNMNAEMYGKLYEPMCREQMQMLQRFLRGDVRTYASCDTLQVRDYSKFNLGAFDPVHKQQVHEEQFPKDLEAAFEMGTELGS